jgi:hypothetical protein
MVLNDVYEGKYMITVKTWSNYCNYYKFWHDKGKYSILLLRSASYGYCYAGEVMFGRYELMEKVISKSSYYSYLYADDIIKGRFELGEEAIAKDGDCSYYYAKKVIKGRFELGELEIKKNIKICEAYEKLFNCKL